VQTGDATARVERNPHEFTRVHLRIGAFNADDRRRAELILEGVGKRIE